MLLIRAVAIVLNWLSRLVPDAGERELWRYRWVQQFPHYTQWLESRGHSSAERRRHLVRYVQDGASEAAAARWPDGSPFDALWRWGRHPAASLLFPPLAVLALGLAWSRGAEPLRHALWTDASPTPLVSAIPTKSFFGKNTGFTARQFDLVRTRARSYAAFEGYALRNLDGRRIAFVTPGLFALVGVPAGQTALASAELGPAWIGRWIHVAGRNYRVSGVWPRALRPSPARPDFWIPETLATFAERRYDTFPVAALRPGVAMEAATAELQDLLLSAPPRKGSGTPNQVVPLVHGQAGVMEVLWIGFLALVAGLVVFTAYRLGGAEGWRKELFFAAKAVPLVTGVFLSAVAWLGTFGSGSAAGPFFVYWCSGVATALGLWWAWRDQHLRCHTCLSRMTLAVQVGTHGAPLLEGVGDELLCEYGHGSLWVPGAPSQAFGPEVWRGE